MNSDTQPSPRHAAPARGFAFDSVLVANRGEIACRVIRTVQRLGLRAVAVHSEADVAAAHVALADESVLLGPAPAQESYLDPERVLAAARDSGAQAIHPGYGFLSENADFARAVQAAGLIWIGPDPDTIAAVGDKRAARDVMAAAGVPVGGGGEITSEDQAVEMAATAGYPVIVKASAGGGGIGMRVCQDEAALRAAVGPARENAARMFSNDGLLLERYLVDARHVEVQVLGLAGGRVVVLGERDCSVQRRYQKLIEETPSPGVSPALRARLHEAARAGMQAIGYLGAGTVECLVSGEDFVFLEVNARLQVEHPVTEEVTGLDLVEEQLRVASDLEPTFDPDEVTTTGHAIELRICAEDPKKFLPRPGTITGWVEPTGEGVRVDSGVRAGDSVTPYYDPMVAKLIVHGADREQALDRAAAAVADFHIEGLTTNLPFHAEVLADETFRAGTYDTGYVKALRATR